MVHGRCEVAVIGGGLSGLATAWELRRRGIDAVVVESANRVGGVIRTRKENGFTYEEGPNSGVLAHEEVRPFLDGLGLTPEIANASSAKRYVLKDGKWCALPSGPLSAITTPLFSLGDKLGILGESRRPKGTDPDETLKSMVLRRLGQSFLDYAVDPFVLGIYAGDPAQLVTRHALPKLYNLEQQYGSIIKGGKAKSREKKAALARGEAPSTATREIFSFDGGLSSLIDTLAAKIEKENLVTGARDLEVRPIPPPEPDLRRYGRETETEREARREPDAPRYLLGWRAAASLAPGVAAAPAHPRARVMGTWQVLEARTIVTAVPAHALRTLLNFAAAPTLADLGNLTYAPVVQFQVGFNQWKGRPLDGFGGLIPFKEKRDLLGALFLSSSFANRAPDGGALLSVFLGGMRRPELTELKDAELEAVVARELTSLMGLSEFKPDLLVQTRYRSAIPQYGVETDKRIAAAKSLEERHAGLVIGGNLMGGIGMADRIRQGVQIAERLAGEFGK
jgi:oxygen-dependent protoporphyrinogen oxidase